jgi:hypothetical protein
MKAKPKEDDPKQSERFKEAARKAEVDENPGAFDEAFKKVVPPKPPKDRTPQA